MKRILLIALLLCIHLPERANSFNLPLSCPRRTQGPPCQEFWITDAVFIGTVTQIVTVSYPESYPGHWQQFQKLTAKLTVEETFRGIVDSEITFEMSDCYYPFKQGEKYLIYANKGQDGKLYQRLGDTRTSPLSEAGEDLEYIRNLSKAPEGGRIYGKVYNHIAKVTLHSIGAPTNYNATLPGVKIVAEGKQQSYETITDNIGSFEFVGLPEGFYKIQAFVPSHFSGTLEGAKLSNRGCSPVRFSIQATGAITGKVLDTRGQPIENLTVSIFSAEGVTNEVLARLEPHYEQRDTTDKQGQFRFSKLPSGRYLIAVNLLKQYIKTPNVYPRTFYPGVLNLSGAGIITLNDGELKQNIELKLPPI